MARGARLTDEERRDYEKRSGLDRLKSFIPEKDYNDTLVEFAGRNTEQLDADGFTNPTRDAMIDKAEALLTYLRDNGYDYSITSDRNEGQVKATIASTGASVRILDLDKNAPYVGRVYDNGLSYRFKNVNQGNSVSDIPPEAAVDLLRYAMGESVHRVSNVGATPVELNETVGTPDMSKFGTPHTFKNDKNDNFSTLYSRGRNTYEMKDGVSRTINNDLVIMAVPESKTRNNKYFDANSPEGIAEAEEFIEISRSDAIKNFTETLKLEAVDKLAQSKAANEFDGDPSFSAGSFVSEMQRSYYKERLDIYSSADYEDANVRNDALFEQDERFKQQVSDVFGSVSDRSINPVNVSAYMNTSSGTIVNESNLLRALKAVQKSGSAYEITGDGFAENGFKDKLINYDATPVYDKDGNQLYPKNINPASKDYDKLSDFWKNIGNAVNSGLSETGVNVSSINVDRNGIIHYEGSRHIGSRKVSKAGNNVIGNIGQVFEPEPQSVKEDGSPNLKEGLIETKFNSGNNYYIAPGYEAYITPPVGDDVDKDYIKRTVCRGYEQIMTDVIKSTLRHDVIADNNYDNVSGLNRVYHHLYGTKHPLNFEEQMIQEGKDVSMAKAILDTERRRVSYDKVYVDGTNMLAETEAKKKADKMNRGYNVYLDCVHTNIAIPKAEMSKGYFDQYATGTGLNQGRVRYLTSDSKVDTETGRIIPGEKLTCPLMEHPDFQYAMYNPPDRLNMSFMNALNQSSTARGNDVTSDGKKIDPIGVGTASMSLGGFTQDDAVVVSKKFAEKNMIRGKDGEMRALKIEDKLCDHSGNKGVISYIADPDRDPSFYEHKSLRDDMSEKERAEAIKYNNTRDMYKRIDDIYRNNPSLDIICAPYTAPSRMNGGTARELIASQEKAHEAGLPTTLKFEGKEYSGSIGYTPWIVTDMPVDEKTHLYDTEGGRKASGQLVWGLAEAGADKVIDEIYKYNDEPTIKARELMLAVGLDMSQTGEFHRLYQPHIVGTDENGKPVYEQRNEVSVKDAFDENKDATGKLHGKNYNEAFSKALNEDGGFMKLPFPVKMATGDMTPEKLDENGKPTGEYMLPILAGKYRSGRETVDNKLMVHEFTTNYKDIWDSAGRYLEAKRLYDEALANGEAASIQKQSENMQSYQQKAQLSYNVMADKITDRYFTGKHNVWKDDVMRKQLHGTATAVISPDPTLDINEICMSATMAEALKVNQDDPNLIVWRDPLLSAGGIRNFSVRIVENRPDHEDYDPNHPYNDMVGISMNPSSATSFEGDFDGDSVGIYAPRSKEAIECAKKTLSYPVQMLNRETKKDGEHDLYFQTGLDVAAGVYADKQKGEDGLKIEERMNYAKSLANNAVDKSIDRNSDNVKAYEIYNAAMHDAHNAAFGCDVISFESPRAHFESLIPMTESGAKGSLSKLADGYAPYFGVKVTFDENGKIDTFEDLGKPYASDSDREASFAATQAKAVLTGVAGKFSQHAIMMAKNLDDGELKKINGAKEALEQLGKASSDSVNKFSEKEKALRSELAGCDRISDAAAATSLTHPVTQSVMQLKHDKAEDIRRKIDMIHNVAPELWAGHKIERYTYKDADDNDVSSWRVVTEKDANGKDGPVFATPDEWKKMFNEFYTDKNGLNVDVPNPAHVETMARIMTVKGENGKEYIKGFDTKTKDILPTEKPLDRLAYECNLARMTELADAKAKLFDGSVNELIAPKTIRNNIAEMQKADEAKEKGVDYTPNLKAIAAKDTQVKPVLDTPSVDAVNAVLKATPDAEIHIDDGSNKQQTEWERAGHKRHLSDGRVIDVKPATVRRSYDKLDPSAQFEVAKEVYEMSKTGNKDYNKTQNDYVLKFREQFLAIKNAGDGAAQRAYMSEHAGELKEYDMYRAIQKQDNEKQKATKAQAAPNTPMHYSELSPESKAAVAQAVTNKSFKPVNERNYTSVESEFVSAVKEQHAKYHSFKTTADRNAYRENNAHAFDDYLMFDKLYKQSQAERNAESAKTVNPSPKTYTATASASVSEAPVYNAQKIKSEQLSEASGLSKNISRTVSDNQEERNIRE